MTYLMLCKHKKTKMKLIAWAIYSRRGHEQGFRMGRCCCLCGKEVFNDGVTGAEWNLM